jgi:hypothetical protein
MNEFELFSGKREKTGKRFVLVHLSNQAEILRKCPPRFRVYNEWSEGASAFYGMGHMGDWQWRSDDKAVREQQLVCLRTISDTMGYEHGDKLAVMSWMLSVMLAVPPKLSAGQRGDVFRNIPQQSF